MVGYSVDIAVHPASVGLMRDQPSFEIMMTIWDCIGPRKFIGIIRIILDLILDIRATAVSQGLPGLPITAVL